MMRLSVACAAAFVLATASASASSCQKDDETCDVVRETPRSSSLMQKKIAKHNVKGTHTQKQLPDGDDCTGITSQGRCWFLSDLGESCSETCAKHTRSFSYAIADPDSPVTPKLVYHEPKVKQEPWAALECYVPSEDRYHPANQNAARHYVEEASTWNHENCMLACPCGARGSENCSWEQPPKCAPKFMWHGVEYEGCATVDMEHEKPWCQHNYQHTEKGDQVRDWSYCTYSCEGEVKPEVKPAPVPPKQESECGWMPAVGCVKEFDYKGVHYVGCTGMEQDSVAPWCSNSDPYVGSWSRCVYTCPEDERPELPAPKPVEEKCDWTPHPECQNTTTFKGKDYTGCIERDNPVPWCSRDRVHREHWEPCTCGPVPPAPEREPQRIEDPCTRHPEVENDEIGNKATLDEAGYKITSSAESPINMKRFVCRVVDKLGCRVTDQAALLGFVPFYSGLHGEQTYQKLDLELKTLCDAGGKWVQPKQ